MIWFENAYDIDGTQVWLEGCFSDSVVTITASFWKDKSDIADGMTYKCLYEKPVNMWVHQEILAEDILAKYMGMIRKCERNLQSLVEREKLNKRI